MLNDMNKSSLFCDYYKQWVEVYKGCDPGSDNGKIQDDLKVDRKTCTGLEVVRLTRDSVSAAFE